jgi:hypothetical protein
MTLTEIEQLWDKIERKLDESGGEVTPEMTKWMPISP